MTLLADANGQPTPLTRQASHLLVGALGAAIVNQYSGRDAALFAFVFLALVHACLDAPVAGLLVNTLA